MRIRRPLPLIAALALAGSALSGPLADLNAQTRLEPFSGVQPGQSRPAPVAPRAAPGPAAAPAPLNTTPLPTQPLRPAAPIGDPIAAGEQKATSNVEASNDYFVRLRQDIQRRQQKVATLEAELNKRETAYREMTQDLNDKAQQQAASRSAGGGAGNTASALAGAGGAGGTGDAGAAGQGQGDELTQKYKQAETQVLYIRSLKYDIAAQKKEIARLSALLRR